MTVPPNRHAEKYGDFFCSTQTFFSLRIPASQSTDVSVQILDFAFQVQRFETNEFRG